MYIPRFEFWNPRAEVNFIYKKVNKIGGIAAKSFGPKLLFILFSGLDCVRILIWLKNDKKGTVTKNFWVKKGNKKNSCCNPGKIDFFCFLIKKNFGGNLTMYIWITLCYSEYEREGQTTASQTVERGRAWSVILRTEAYR